MKLIGTVQKGLVHQVAKMRFGLIIPLLIVIQVGHTQPYLNFIEGKRYLRIDQLPVCNQVELIDTVFDSRVEILLYNVFFETQDSTQKYLLTLSVLPDSQWHFPAETDDPIPEKLIRKNEITYEELMIKVDSSIHSVIALEGGLGDRLWTYNIMPVVNYEGEYYAYENKVLSECFLIKSKPASSSSFDINKLKDFDQINSFASMYKPAVINTEVPPVSQEEKLAVIKQLNQLSVEHYGEPPINMADSFAVEISSPFRNSVLLRGKKPLTIDKHYMYEVKQDSVYYFHYTPYFAFDGKPQEGLTDFYYHPCIGIVGASYAYYFKRFYNWIPGVSVSRKLIFTAKTVNGVYPYVYIQRNCQ